MRILSAPDATSVYLRAERLLKFHRCKVCGMTTPIDAARTLSADLADALREDGGYSKRRLEVAAAQFRDRALDN